MFGVCLSDVVSGWSVISQASWTFTCPAHCSSSVLPWFLSGILVGSLCCVLLACFALLAYFRSPLVIPGCSSVPPSRSSSGLRLRGYLHEHWISCCWFGNCCSLLEPCGWQLGGTSLWDSALFGLWSWLLGSDCRGASFWHRDWDPSFPFSWIWIWASRNSWFDFGLQCEALGGAWSICSCRACLASWVLGCSIHPVSHILHSCSCSVHCSVGYCLGCSSCSWNFSTRHCAKLGWGLAPDQFA